MNLNTLDEAIEILEAMKAGKWVQNYNGGEWVNSLHALPNFAHFRYRVRVEPLEAWVNVYPLTGQVHHASEAQAKMYSGFGATRIAVHMREVES